MSNNDEEADKKLSELIDMLEAEEKANKNEGSSRQIIKEYHLRLRDFELPRQLILEFCIYLSGNETRLVIESQIKGYEKSRRV